MATTGQITPAILLAELNTLKNRISSGESIVYRTCGGCSGTDCDKCQYVIGLQTEAASITKVLVSLGYTPP